MENKRNTQENVRKNLEIKLQTDLPPRGRQNWDVKGNQMQKGSHLQEQIERNDNTHHSATEKGHFPKGPRSHVGLSDDDFYNTSKEICQEKIMQSHTFGLEGRTSNNIFQLSTNPFMSDYSP